MFSLPCQVIIPVILVPLYGRSGLIRVMEILPDTIFTDT
jgi:hypothetical protein